MGETPEITDAAKQLADENDVDWTLVTGTGQDGRILKSDIEDALVGERLFDRYVTEGSWKGQTNYVCDPTGYSTLDRYRMKEHLIALYNKGQLTLDDLDGEEESEDDES